MGGGGIFLIQDNGQLVEMNEQPYEAESHLQELLARYPRLLSGEQMSSQSPRRWLLISREAPLPDAPDASGRWSVDHLFLDQDGIPTLVEVKRSTDTRIRREVVGQMLDYAANAVVHWPVEAIKAQFYSRCEKEGIEPTDQLAELLGPEGPQEEAFWDMVNTNLQAGKVRMVFVADQIPKELRRVVEFLNSQMRPAEVLAVELRQYVSQDVDQAVRTLVPRLIGQTEQTIIQKGSGTVGKDWTEVEFFSTLAEECGPEAVNLTRKLLEWARSRSLQIEWGKGKRGALIIKLSHNAIVYSLFYVYTDGKIQVPFDSLKRRPAFQDEAIRRQFLNHLIAASALSNIPPTAIESWPTIPLAAFQNGGSVDQFMAAIEWAIKVIQAP